MSVTTAPKALRPIGVIVIWLISASEHLRGETNKYTRGSHRGYGMGEVLWAPTILKAVRGRYPSA
jgi:hypothetical protein